MPHETPLIATIVAGLGLAFVRRSRKSLPHSAIGRLPDRRRARRPEHARFRGRSIAGARAGGDRGHPADVRRRSALLIEGSSVGPRNRGAAPSGEIFALPADFGIWGVLGVTLAKVVAFVALMVVVGRRVIPWVLHYVAHTGSRELFRLAVLAIALVVAFGAAKLFGVSLALGRSLPA